MLGSCCEEQEAKEAKARAEHRAATRLSESRLLSSQRVRQELYDALRHGTNCECCPIGVECDESEEEPDDADKSEAESHRSSDDDDFSDDPDEQALLDKMRLARLGEIKAASSEAASRRQAGHGAYLRIRSAQLLALLHEADVTVICHIGVDGESGCGWLDQLLASMAPKLEHHRFVRVSGDNGPLPFLPSVRELPALLLLRGGMVLASSSQIAEIREREHFDEFHETWILEQLKLLASKGEGTGESDSEDESGTSSFCGRKGCRAYPHEHVAWGKRAQEERQARTLNSEHYEQTGAKSLNSDMYGLRDEDMRERQTQSMLTRETDY